MKLNKIWLTVFLLKNQIQLSQVKGHSKSGKATQVLQFLLLQTQLEFRPSQIKEGTLGESSPVKILQTVA